VTAADDSLAPQSTSTAFVASTPGSEPADVEGGSIERAVAELSAADFDRWLGDLVREVCGVASSVGDSGWPPVPPPERAERDTGPWPDPGDRIDHHGHEHDRLAVEDLSAAPADAAADTPGGGWWAAADRAVDQAGAAVHAARQALGAAGRMVRTAQRADAADEAAWQAGAAGRVTAADDALDALIAAADTQREGLAVLLSATAGGGLADRAPHRGHRRRERRVTGAHRPARAAPGRHLRTPRLSAPARELRPRPHRPSRAGPARRHCGLPAGCGTGPLHPGP
jgi:hypothetical protein